MLKQTKNSKNKNILILGGLGVIGLEISKKFHSENYNVEILDKKNITKHYKKNYPFLNKIKHHKINLVNIKILR